MPITTKNVLARLSLGAFALATVLLSSCRGGISEKPPIHLVPDMDFQPKLRAQAEEMFAGWADHRSMRLPVDGTVANSEQPDVALAHKDASGKFVTANPVKATAAVLARGRERFEINCSPCHGYTGQGGPGLTNSDPEKSHGLVGRRWPVAIPNFHFVQGADNRVANLVDGEIFDVITNGKGTMPAYGARINPADRWAIVHYVRALQNLSK